MAELPLVLGVDQVGVGLGGVPEGQQVSVLLHNMEHVVSIPQQSGLTDSGREKEVEIEADLVNDYIPKVKSSQDASAPTC